MGCNGFTLQRQLGLSLTKLLVNFVMFSFRNELKVPKKKTLNILPCKVSKFMFS